MKLIDRFAEELGWYGLIAVLVGYFLISMGFVLENNWIYIMLNFTGSLGLCIIAYKKKARSLVLFYFLWAIISLF